MKRPSRYRLTQPYFVRRSLTQYALERCETMGDLWEALAKHTEPEPGTVIVFVNGELVNLPLDRAWLQVKRENYWSEQDNRNQLEE